jgi:hypothetical protein
MKDPRADEESARGERAMSDAQRFFDLLTEQGYKPVFEQDGEHTFVVFESEGLEYVVVPDSEAGYLHVSAAQDLDSELDLSESLLKANAINVTSKIVKTVIEDDTTVSFHFEAVVFDDESSRTLLKRAIAMLKAASTVFFFKMPARDPMAN